MNTVDERLMELELRYSSLQDEFEKLSSVVFEQQKRLDIYEAEILRLRDSVSNQGWSEAGPQSEKPPHY